MGNVKINANSVNKNSYSIYTDISNNTVIALDDKGKEKVENVVDLYKGTSIPDNETVRGIVLKRNSETGSYEMTDQYLNEFKINNLFLSHYRIDWN